MVLHGATGCSMEHHDATGVTTPRQTVKASPHRHNWLLSHGAPADPSDPWNSHAAPVSPRQNCAVSFLTEPRYTLVVDDPANIWAIGLLFVVGLIVSGVAFTSRQRATEAALLRRQATVLQGYSRDVVAADSTKAIVSVTSQALAALFRVPVVVMLV